MSSGDRYLEKNSCELDKVENVIRPTVQTPRDVSPKTSTQIRNRTSYPSPKTLQYRAKSPNSTKLRAKQSSLSPKRPLVQNNQGYKQQPSPCNEDKKIASYAADVKKCPNLIPGDNLEEKCLSKKLFGAKNYLADDNTSPQEDMKRYTVKTMCADYCHPNVWDEPLPMCYNDVDVQTKLLAMYSDDFSSFEGQAREFPGSIDQIFGDIFTAVTTDSIVSPHRLPFQSTIVPVFVDDFDKANNADDTDCRWSDVYEGKITQLASKAAPKEVSIDKECNTNYNNGDNGSEDDKDGKSQHKSPASLNTLANNKVANNLISQDLCQSFANASQVGYTNQSFEDISLGGDSMELRYNGTACPSSKQGTFSSDCAAANDREDEKRNTNHPITVFQRARKMTRDAFSKVRGRSPTPTDVREALGSVLNIGKTVLQKSKKTIKGAQCVSMDNEVEYSDCFDAVNMDLEALKRISNEMSKSVIARKGIQSMVAVNATDQAGNKDELSKIRKEGHKQFIHKELTQSREAENIGRFENSFNCVKKKSSELIQQHNIQIKGTENENDRESRIEEGCCFGEINKSNEHDLIFCYENGIAVDENEPWEKIHGDHKLSEKQTNKCCGSNYDFVESRIEIAQIETNQPHVFSLSSTNTRGMNKDGFQICTHKESRDDNFTLTISGGSNSSSGSPEDIATSKQICFVHNDEFKRSEDNLNLHKSSNHMKPTIVAGVDVLFKSSMSDGSIDPIHSASDDMPRKTVSLVISNEAEHQDRDITEVIALISDEVSLKRYPSLPDLTDLEKDGEPSVTDPFNSKDSLDSNKRLSKAGDIDIEQDRSGIKQNGDSKEIRNQRLGEDENSFENQQAANRCVEDHGYDTDEDQRSSDLSSSEGVSLNAIQEKAFKMDVSTPPNSPRDGLPLESSTVNTIISLFETTSILNKSASNEDTRTNGQDSVNAIQCGGSQTIDVDPNNKERAEKNNIIIVPYENIVEEDELKSRDENTIDTMFKDAAVLLHSKVVSAESIELCDASDLLASNGSCEVCNDLKRDQLLNDGYESDMGRNIGHLSTRYAELDNDMKVKYDQESQSENENERDGIGNDDYLVPISNDHDDELEALLVCLPSPPSSSLANLEEDTTQKDNEIHALKYKYQKGTAGESKKPKIDGRGFDIEMERACAHLEENQFEQEQVNHVNDKNIEPEIKLEDEIFMYKNAGLESLLKKDSKSTNWEEELPEIKHDEQTREVTNTGSVDFSKFSETNFENRQLASNKYENPLFGGACSTSSAEGCNGEELPIINRMISPILVRKDQRLTSTDLSISPKRHSKQSKVTWAMDHTMQQLPTIYDQENDDDTSSSSVYDFSNSCQTDKARSDCPSQDVIPYNKLGQPDQSTSDHTSHLLEMAKATLDQRKTVADCHYQADLCAFTLIKHLPVTPAPPSSPNCSPYAVHIPTFQENRNNQSLKGQYTLPPDMIGKSPYDTTSSIQASYTEACDMIDRVSDKMESNLEAVRRASLYIKRTQQQVHLCDELMARSKNTLTKSAEISAKVRSQVEKVARFLSTTDKPSEYVRHSN